MPIRGDRLRWPPRPGKRSNAARAGADAARTDARDGTGTEARDAAARSHQPGGGAVHGHDERDVATRGEPRRPETRDDAPRGNGTRDTGTRQTLSTDEQTPAPRQPNEHDTSSDSQASGPRDVIRRAHEDVTGGQMDTDCRNSAVEVVERNESKRRRTP